MKTKAITIRYPAELAAEMEAIARAEGVSVSEAMRAAARHYIASRSSDADFKERIAKRVEEDRKLMERLAK